MLDVLISGKLIRDPQSRIGPSGKPFCTALVRVPTEKEESLVASVIAFGDTGERLGRLRSNDAVSMTGSAKLSSWEKNGEQQHGLSITAQGILTAYDVKKRRGDTDTKAAPNQRQERDSRAATRPPANDDGGQFDDAIPF